MKKKKLSHPFISHFAFLHDRLQIHQWSNATIKRIIREKWAVKGGSIKKNVDMMVTPRVVEEVRRHFNCSELEGAELEDQGGEGMLFHKNYN
jgi:leishmanolysin-like peptidase